MAKSVTTWTKGVSGNPKGRQKDVRTVAILKNDLELAVREKLTPAAVTKIVHRLVDIAQNSPEEKLAISAGKTILDYALSKQVVQDAVKERAPITIIIENATLAAQAQAKPPVKVIEVVDGQVNSDV